MGRLATLVCLLVIATPTPAATLRCGRWVVAEGDPASVLRRRCGAPTHAAQREVRQLRRHYPDAANCEEMTIGPDHRFGTQIECEPVDGGIDEYEIIPYEAWTYNFGPKRLMVEIEVSGGRIITIRKGGGYGY